MVWTKYFTLEKNGDITKLNFEFKLSITKEK